MVEANFAKKAIECREKGESTLKGGFFSRMLGSAQDRADEAKEHFVQAANCYKHCRDVESAVEMYMKAAECESEDGIKAGLYKEAALTIKASDTDRYLKLTRSAIKLFSIAGRMSQACSMAKDCAEKLEEDYNYEQARDFYEEAAKLYEIDNVTTYQNTMLGKWADLTILTDNFNHIGKVIKTYDKIGKKYLSTGLIKSSAKDFFFKAVLCFLANDDVPGAKNSIENYSFDDPSFERSIQWELLQGMIAAIEAMNGDQLSEVVR